MSPVSRSRRRKKTSSGSGGRKAARTTVVEEPRSRLSEIRRQFGLSVGAAPWFEPAVNAVLDQADVVLDAQHPRALAQLTSRLVGAPLHDVLVTKKEGLWFDRWFDELVSATEQRVREQVAAGDGWEAPFRLLHGLAAIGTPAPAQAALAATGRLRKLICRAPGQDPGPRWPLEVRRFRADGDIVRLRDVWGTRYAVIAGFSYGGRDRSVFLFDVDTDFYRIVVGAGDFDDVEQAATAWQQWLGDTAADARVEAVDHAEQLDCLVHLDMDESLLPMIPDRSVTDNWFGAQRRLQELRTTLHRRMGPIVAPSLYDVDTDAVADEFVEWYVGRHGLPPDHEVAAVLAHEWMSGLIPETWFAVSPARLHHQCELISDWVDDDLTRAVIALLPEWVTWLADRAGYAEPFRTRLMDAVRTETARWQ